MMSEARKCPCGKQMVEHQEPRFDECIGCGALGIPWYARETSNARGKECPRCERKMLHELIKSGCISVRICTMCGYTVITPQ
jgi:hypothetical protein